MINLCEFQMKKSGSTHKIKVRKGNDNFMPWVLSKFFHRPSKNLITILFCKPKLLWQVHVDTCSWSIRGNHQPKWPPKPDKLNAFGPQKAPFYLASGFNVLYWTKSSNWDLVFLPESPFSNRFEYWRIERNVCHRTRHSRAPGTWN